MVLPGGTQQGFLLPPIPDQVVGGEEGKSNNNLFALAFDGSPPALEEGLDGGAGSAGDAGGAGGAGGDGGAGDGMLLQGGREW